MHGCSLLSGGTGGIYANGRGMHVELSGCSLDQDSVEVNGGREVVAVVAGYGAAYERHNALSIYCMD